jgi:DNA-binding CsgD family transcriptional regulator
LIEEATDELGMGVAMAAGKLTVESVAQSWYAAGFGQCPWPEVLSATADLFGGGGAAVLEIDRTNGQVGRIHVHMDYSRALLEDSRNDYVTRMNGINPRMQYSLRRPGPHLVTDYRVLPEPALGRTEFYDWIERYHGVRYFIGARIYDDGPRSLCASVEFTRRHGHVDEQTEQTFRRLLPHMANAWRISGLVHALDHASNVVDLLVAQQVGGVVGIRADGFILFMNAAAEDAIASDDGLTVHGGHLHAARAASDRSLQNLVARILQSRPGELPDGGGAIAVPRPSGRAPFALRAVPCVRGSEYHYGQLPAALVLIADAEHRAAPSDATLFALGFSPTETRIAQRLARGRTLADVARDLGMAHNTARAHLRSIFAKTQARSQVELVRILGEFARLDGPPPWSGAGLT